ncbi:hypothetical protein GCM10009810_19660 [Nostocoides vanveenii]|uniref:Uncharacterized protein n=1 Tax=Nostocoides vanveenii TaxID=330835 RepID=A0ABN2KP98_9MICO
MHIASMHCECQVRFHSPLFPAEAMEAAPAGRFEGHIDRLLTIRCRLADGHVQIGDGQAVQ